MGVFKKLGKEIGDLSILQVQTFTGNLKAFINTEADANAEGDGKTIIKWQELLEKAKEEGEIEIVAASRVNIDGDTELFISDDASSSILEAHIKAVAAAQEVRAGLLKALDNLL